MGRKKWHFLNILVVSFVIKNFWFTCALFLLLDVVGFVCRCKKLFLCE